MKKTVLTLALISLLGAGSEARTLSPAEALARANGKAAGVRVSRATGAAVPMMTFGTADEPAVYVFDKAEGGYVIVSADDVAAPVLGYSDNGVLDPANLPSNLRWWLGQYEAEIQKAREAGAESYMTISRADRAAIAPMVKTRWDQGAPYNLLCPELNGTRTVTGCVATAMAQVMKYHNWPEQLGANANFSYEWEAGGQTLSWNAANTRFDWANMADSYASGSYTDAQANAVATLMKACGYASDMEYNVSSAGGSGASSFTGACALVDYFGYDRGVNVQLRDYFTTDEWADLVYNNLTTCGPVLYSGHNDHGGHAFVCDGYQANGYFHFNWGWSGMSDGYFLLSALDPDNQGIGGSVAGYNSGQMITLGVRKPSGGKDVVNMIVDGKLSAEKSGNSIAISVGGLFNYSTMAIDGSVVARIVPENGGAEKISSIQIFTGLKPGYGWGDATFSLGCSAVNFPSNGTFKVYLGVKNNADGQVTDAKVSTEQEPYFEVTRSGTKYTVSMPVSGAYSVNNMKIETPIFASGAKFLVTGNACWSGSKSVVKEIFGLLLKNGSAVALGSTMPLDLKPGNVDNYFDYLAEWVGYGQSYPDGIPAGTYQFVMACEIDGKLKTLCNPVDVEVQAAPAAATLEVTDWTIANSDALDPNNVTVTMTVNCKSGYFFSSIAAAAFTAETQQYVTEFNSPIFSLQAGESKTLSFTGSIPGATPGSKYLMALFTDKQITNARIVTVAGQSAIDDINVDADGGEAVYYNLQGVRVENPSNGIFIRRQGGKTEKVFIK